MAGSVISRRILLGALILGTSGGAVWLTTSNRAPAADVSLTPPEVLEQLRAGKLVLVDIRRPDEWARTGVAEGALRIDMRRKDFVEALRKASRDNPGLPMAFICAAGVRSRWVSNALADAGLTEIIDVPEGMLGSSAGPGWLARGLPVVEYSG